MRIRRWTTGGLAPLLAVPLVVAIGAAASPAQAATGPYSGTAVGDLVHVNVLDVPAISPGLADVHVARSTVDVNSTGLADPAGKRSHARSTNLDAPLLGGAIDLNPLLSTAEQSAPPTAAAAATDSLTGPISLAPIVSLEAATANARAVWGATDASCVPVGTDIANSKTAVADLGLLGPLPLPTGTALVWVDNADGGAAYSQSSLKLADVAGQSNKALVSDVTDQIDGIVLLKGSGNDITLNVVAPPEITATATGHASSSSVTYTEPIIQVLQGTAVLGTLDADSLNLDISIPPGGIPALVLRLQLGTLTGKTISDTGASGSAKLLGVTLLGAAGIGTLATVDVAPMSVSATVPTGGITCANDPLANLQVDASTPTVLPNGSFQYAITVPNTGDCTLSNVKVVLNVTGPNGTTITSTDPAATIAGLTATWPDIGTIAPGALKTLKATVKVPSNAPANATFTGTATATGNCEGAPASHTATSGPVPTVGSASDTGCDLSASSISSSHKEVRIGDYFNEYVRLSNLGKAACSGIKVTVPYPPDTSFVSCTDTCTHDDAKRVVTWTVPSLASGVSKDLVATFKVNASGKPGENLGTIVTITSGKQVVTDKTTLPVITSSNVLNSGAQRSRGILPRTGADLPTGLALTLLGAFLGLRGLRRRRRIA